MMLPLALPSAGVVRDSLEETLSDGHLQYRWSAAEIRGEGSKSI